MSAAEHRPTKSPPRSSAEIFEDIRALSRSAGALHEISALIYRDWVVTIDTEVGRVVDDPAHRWSKSKLNNNELTLLLGLVVQAPNDRTYSVQAVNGTFAASADHLLRELHDRIVLDCTPTFNSRLQSFVDRPESIGLTAKEAIYYGPDGFYLHQFP